LGFPSQKNVKYVIDYKHYLRSTLIFFKLKPNLEIFFLLSPRSLAQLSEVSAQLGTPCLSLDNISFVHEWHRALFHQGWYERSLLNATLLSPRLIASPTIFVRCYSLMISLAPSGKGWQS